ncbi:uncharacterized protein LOC120251463 [Dioscorea cayenensis subsp. rotundata]|uniref:Uncharacterized protein LOC120251463 n=1 Tax=Dioscorea cayennensis subsp. rotundata TaxID=55577 RepID=A0AB40ALY4_DIOCR|nr:uncharacterized protein LOC120251463 [Dioscorea cayenensis subsp. rotundata]
MDSDLEGLSFTDFMLHGNLNLPLVQNTFGPNLDWSLINSIRFDFNAQNLWVWGPRSLRTSVASAVYDYLITLDPQPWPGWSFIWKLFVLPRVRTFIWKLAHGKLPSGDYLYGLNIGPFTLCHFCGLAPESASHTIWNCPKIMPCWISLCASFNLDPNVLAKFDTGIWLTNRFVSKNSDAFFKALIANLAWIIWKDRCNLIFKGWQPKYHSIFGRAWSYCTNFFNSIAKNIMEYSIPSCPLKNISLFTDASWSDSSPVSCGLGFIAISNVGQVLLAGAMGCSSVSPISAEIAAILFALDQCIVRLINHFDNCVAWHYKREIDSLKSRIINTCSAIKTIPRTENLLADALAHFGRSNPHLSLFSQGLDRPRWLEDLCLSLNLFF